MSETATYQLSLDWNNDGDFSDSGEDITADFRNASITCGFSSHLARVAGTGRMTLQLNNLSRTYSPPLNANVLPRRPVRFTMTYGGTTSTLFRGYLEDIQPTYGQYGTRQVTLICVDDMDTLNLHDGQIPMLTDIYADDIIQAAVAAAYTPASTAYQQGLNYFPTSAPDWQHAARTTWQLMQDGGALQKITDACMSDWGRFFIAGDGIPTFMNRHQMALDTSTELTLDNTMLNMDYSYPVATVRNHVQVTCYPRTIGEFPETLGQLDQSQAPVIEIGESAGFVISFRDPVNSAVTVGGLDPITPVAGTDYVCTADPEGEGEDLTDDVSITLVSYGDRAELTLTNNASVRVWVQSLRVRGSAVRAKEPLTVIASDETSIDAYGKRELQVDAPLMSDPGDAQALADYLLSVYKDPLNRIDNIEILANKDAAWMAAVRDLELLDRVVLSEDQTGLSGFVGFISQMTHQINSRWEHRLRFSIEQQRTISTPFRVGVSQLNSGHVLVY